MKGKHRITRIAKSAPAKRHVLKIRIHVAEQWSLEAAEANQLPPDEQLARFARVLRQHDGGNQPA